MFCRSCGAEVNNNAKFCPHCGSKRIDMEAVAATSDKSKDASAGTAILMLVIVVILIGFGVKAIITLGQEGAFVDTPLYDNSILTIRVESTHIIYSADYELFIDGDNVESFRLAPGMYYEVIYKFSTLVTEPDRFIEIKVISTGGGIGTQSDSAMVLIGTGQNYNMTLAA